MSEFNNEVMVVNRDTLKEYRKTYPVYFKDVIAGTIEKYTPTYRTLILNGNYFIQCECLKRHDTDAIEIDSDMVFIEPNEFEDLFTKFKKMIGDGD